MMKQKYNFFFLIFICCFLIFKYSYAYFGLGPLIPLIGNAIIFIFIAVVAVIGFLAYPLKKFSEYIKKNRLKNKRPDKDKKNKTIQ